MKKTENALDAFKQLEHDIAEICEYFKQKGIDKKFIENKRA